MTKDGQIALLKRREGLAIDLAALLGIACRPDTTQEERDRIGEVAMTLVLLDGTERLPLTLNPLKGKTPAD